jgi:peroxiredoxin
MATLEVGQTAPDFVLPTLDGQTVRLSELLRAGPVVLVFWKSGCRACDLVFPYLARLAELAPDVPVIAVGQETADSARIYVAQTGIRLPVALDGPDYAVSQLYDPTFTPTIFLVGPDGTIIFKGEGFSKADLNTLAAKVGELTGRPVPEVAPFDDGIPVFRPG